MNFIFNFLDKAWQRIDYFAYPLQDKNKYVEWLETEAFGILDSKGIMAVEKTLENMGFIRIHNSLLSYIFRSPCKNFVLKLTCSNPGYRQFVELALQRQDNPYYPKIYKNIFKGIDKFQMTLMEDLSPLYGHNIFAYRDLNFLNSFLQARNKSFLRMGRKNTRLRQCAADMNRLIGTQHGCLNTTSVMRRGPQLVVIDPVHHLD